MKRIDLFLLGAHLSISDGFKKLFNDADEINAKVIQIFVKSNRSWALPVLDDKKKAEYFSAKKNSKVEKVVAHASYLSNLASFDTRILNNSIRSLIAELVACDEIQIPYLVLHPGSATGETLIDRRQRLQMVSDGLDKIFSSQKFNCKILLENMAGQGTVLGSSFEELAFIRNSLSPSAQKSVGFCLDTCHLFASGRDIVSVDQIDSVLGMFDSHCGLDNLKMVHLNDSMFPLGSKKDRHANIGKGEIGLTLLRSFIRSLPSGIPVILETPDDEGIGVYKKEIEALL